MRVLVALLLLAVAAHADPTSITGQALNNTETHASGTPLTTPEPPSGTVACVLTLSNEQLTLDCTGDHAVAANIDPALAPLGLQIKLNGDNLQQSTSCPTPDVHPQPLVTLCASSAVLSVVNSSITGFVAPHSSPQRPILGIVGAGEVLLENMQAADIQGGTAVRAHGYSAVVVRNSVFVRNAATESIAGALLVTTAAPSMATVHIAGNTFTHNSAKMAGAAAVMLQGQDAISVLIDGVNTFTNNSALEAGAGALLINATGSARSSITLAGDNTFTTNLCWAGGGGASILLEGAHGSNVTVADGTFDSNVARSGTISASGGGLYIAGGFATGVSVVLKGRGEFHANSASRSGGGLYVNLTNSAQASVLLGGAYQFIRNAAKYHGGGAKIDFSGAVQPRATVRKTATFVGNAAAVGGGAYVDFTLSSEPALDLNGDVTFSHNAADDVAGGLMVDVGSVPAGAALSMLGNVTFRNNEAKGALGGGLVFSAPGSARPHVQVRGDVLFEANVANYSAGFAMLLRDTQGAIVDLGPRGIYAYNRALRSGAALGIDATNATSATLVLRGSYQRNVAGHTGGAVAVWADGSTKAKIEFVGQSSWELNSASHGGAAWVTALRSTAAKVIVMEGARLWSNDAYFGGGMYVTVEASEAPNVVLSGSASFRNNTSGGGQGAGLYVRASHCNRPYIRVLQNTEFVENSAATYSAGGGLFLNASFSTAPGLLITDDALFDANTAHWGGGADVRMVDTTEPRVKILGSVLFRGNNATLGGGLHLDWSLARDAVLQAATQVAFSNNSAVGQGGGARIFGSAAINPSVVLAGNVRIDGNVAGAEGGGLAVVMQDSNEATVSIRDGVTFRRNVAGSGAGLYWDAQHSNMATLVAGDTVRFVDNNATGGAGGGALLDWEDTTTDTIRLEGDVAFQGNWAGTFGGGLALITRNILHVIVDIGGRAAFDANTAAAGNGGGLYVDGTDAAVVNVTLSGRTQYIGNSAASGGGFFIDVRNSERANVQLLGNGTVAKGNRARIAGGGGFVDVSGTSELSSFDVQGGIWQFNSADRGGALCVYANSSNTSMALANADFLNNEAVSGAGGALYLMLGPVSTGIQGLSQVAVSRTRFVGNVVTKGGGGAVYAEGSSAALDGCARGLDVSLFGLQPGAPCPPSFTFSECYFEGNNATLGGALYTFSTQAVVTAATFVTNTATKMGGALYVRKMQRMTVGPGVTIQGNSAGKQGGGIYATVSDDLSPNRLAISQAVIVGNAAGAQGGGLLLQGGPTAINDTNILNNTARAQGGGIAYYNVCDEQDCGLRLMQGTHILGNRARTAPAVYLASGTKGVDSAELVAATSEDGTVTAQSAGVGEGPRQMVVQQQEFMVASSTAATGKIDLVVQLDRQDGILVQVAMCDSNSEEDPALLMGTQSKTINGIATFEFLRILKAQVGQRYCLKVTAPDYEDVVPIRVYVTIRDCIAGEIATELGCTNCPANQYSFAYRPDATCRPCAHNAHCAGGVTFVPKCGFWHANTTTTTLLACPNREACCGSRDAIQDCQRTHTCPAGDGYMAKQCSAGYRGRLCGACDRDRGYGASGFLRCTKCVSPFGTAVLIFLAMAVVAALIAYMANTAVHEAQRTVRPETLQSFRKHVDRSADGAALLSPGGTSPAKTLAQRVSDSLAERPLMDATSVFKLLVVHMQYLVLLGSLLVDWPGVVTGTISALKLFVLYSVDNTRVLSLECLGVPGNGGRMLLALLLPLVAVALAAALGGLWRGREAARKSQARRLADDRITISDMVIACCVVGVALIYANLLTTSLSAFSCLRVGSVLYWSRDMDVRCWSDDHLSSSLLWGLLGLLVLCLLLPAAAIAAVVRHQAAVDANTALKPAASEKQFARRFGFLYRLYRPEYCFWEGAVCLQTIILVFISLYGRRAGVYYQVLLDLLVLGASTTVVRVLRPFRTRELQRLYLSSCTVLLLTCIGALALLWEQRIEDNIDGTSLRGFLAFLVLSLNLGYVLLCAYEIWRAVKDATMKKVNVAKEWWSWMKGGRVGSFRPATSISPLGSGDLLGQVGPAGAAEGLWVDNLQRIRQLQAQAQDIETTRLRSGELGSSATMLPMSSVASISFQYDD